MHDSYVYVYVCGFKFGDDFWEIFLNGVYVINLISSEELFIIYYYFFTELEVFISVDFHNFLKLIFPLLIVLESEGSDHVVSE